MTATFASGSDIAWRCRVRGLDRRDGVSFVRATRVIEDTPDHVAALRRPGDEVRRRVTDEHAISLFRPDGSDRLECWYIDLMSPLRSHAAGYEFVENGLDVVVDPDVGSWRWKDEDELDYALENGVYTRAEADALYAEGERAVARLRRERAELERWREWRPDPAWPAARLPAGWDAP